MSTIKVAVASNSLGESTAGHTIDAKLEAAKSHGFDGVEIAFECLDAHAAGISTVASREDRLRAAATHVHKKAMSLSLQLIALNPFKDFDGLRNPHDTNERLKEANLWCQLCQIMHIPIIQVSTALYPLEESRVTTDAAVIATNMRKLGRLAEMYGLKIGYEAPSWGIHKSTWQEVQEILDRVNLPNVGHCLDTFHIASKEAGDPFRKSSPIRSWGLESLYKSLGELKQTVDPANIVYLQLSDATVADEDQLGYSNADVKQPAYMTQSKNCRVFPCEEHLGGSLPVVEIARVIFDMGYTGWVSMEVSNKDMFDDRISVPGDWARRGMESWKRVARRCGLDRRE